MGREHISPKGKRLLVAVVLVGIFLAAGAWFVMQHGSGFDVHRFYSSLRQMHPGWAAAGLILILSTYVGRAVRWRVMIAPMRPKASVWGLTSATIIGFTAVTLFGRPGEFVRPYLIASKEKLPVSSQLAAWLLERIYDLLFVILIFGWALTQVEPRGSVGPFLNWALHTGGYVVAIMGAVCIAVLVSIGIFSETAVGRIREGLGVIPAKYRSRLEGVIQAFVGGMQASRRSTHVLKLVLYTCAEWFLILLSNFCLFRAMKPTATFSLTDTAVFLGFMAFGSVIQIPGIGGGMQVAAVLALVEIFGVGLEDASAVAILLWLTMYVVVVPIGLLLALNEGLSWSRFKQLETDAEKAAADVNTTAVGTS